MSLNETVSAERPHIAFFGKRNAGKSSLVNAVTGQALSVVSEVKGTTTDPVKKAMELLPLGPVVIIDTPGIDDNGELGELRVRKTRDILGVTDVAVIVVDAVRGLCDEDQALISEMEDRKIPYVIAFNKIDLAENTPEIPENALAVSALNGTNVNTLKDMIAMAAKLGVSERRLVSDLLLEGDTVILVTPIDAAAPKGRLILPQQQTLRDVLDSHCSAIVCQVDQLADVIGNLKCPPRLTVTDSQAFGAVSGILPREYPLTSFSILFARYKGDLNTLVRGADTLGSLVDGDRVLISEGCTHHRQCGDIGTEKLPAWIRSYTGAEIEFSFTSGGEFPEDLSSYRLVVHCGGCMLNEKAMAHRMDTAFRQDVPMVNYGVAIAKMNGILERSLEPLKGKY